MSEQYNGIPATVLTNISGSNPILASTNANPIVVETNFAHGLTTGDYVSIINHNNLAANGVWPATVVDSVHFSIPVAGTSIGGTIGTMHSLALGPTYQIPTDGDTLEAASVDVALEALGDRTSALSVSTGFYKIVSASPQIGTTAAGSNWATTTVAASATGQLIDSLQSWAVGQINAGDVIEIDANLTTIPTTSVPYALTIMYAFTAAGSAMGPWVDLPGAWVSGPEGVSTYVPASFLKGAMAYNTTPPTFLTFAIGVHNLGGSNVTVNANGPYTVFIKQYRPTGINQ
jgi:hypothetical protein